MLLYNKYQTGGKINWNYVALPELAKEIQAPYRPVSESTHYESNDAKKAKIEEEYKNRPKVEAAEKRKKSEPLQKEIKKEQQAPENPNMSFSSISKKEAEKSKEFNSYLENPDAIARLTDFAKAPARYISSPLSALGDFEKMSYGYTKFPTTDAAQLRDKMLYYGDGFLSDGLRARLEKERTDENKEVVKDLATDLLLLKLGRLTDFNSPKVKPLLNNKQQAYLNLVKKGNNAEAWGLIPYTENNDFLMGGLEDSPLLGDLLYKKYPSLP